MIALTLENFKCVILLYISNSIDIIFSMYMYIFIYDREERGKLKSYWDNCWYAVKLFFRVCLSKRLIIVKNIAIKSFEIKTEQKLMFKVIDFFLFTMRAGIFFSKPWWKTYYSEEYVKFSAGSSWIGIAALFLKVLEWICKCFPIERWCICRLRFTYAEKKYLKLSKITKNEFLWANLLNISQ